MRRANFSNPIVILLLDYSNLYKNFEYTFKMSSRKILAQDPTALDILDFDSIQRCENGLDTSHDFIRDFLHEKKKFITYIEANDFKEPEASKHYLSIDKVLDEIIKSHRTIEQAVNNQNYLNVLFSNMILSIKEMPFSTIHRRYALNSLDELNLAHCLEPSLENEEAVYRKLKSYNRGLKNRNKNLDVFAPIFENLDSMLLDIEIEMLVRSRI